MNCTIVSCVIATLAVISSTMVYIHYLHYHSKQKKIKKEMEKRIKSLQRLFDQSVHIIEDYVPADKKAEFEERIRNI